jgi:uncharacterized protein YbjT (DUF2867 family)
MPAPRSAIVLGATGAVGSALVRELLAASAWTAVSALVRRPASDLAGLPGAEKLHASVVTMDDLESATGRVLAGRVPPDVAFCTLGVGQPRKVSAAEHRRVDVDYALAFARACHAAGVGHFSLLTSVGADAAARSRYLRVKGDVEAGVRALGFARVSFFRPSLLVTRELRYGLQDRVTQWAFPRLSGLLPSRFREVRVEDLARAMRLDAERAGAGVAVLHHDEGAALLAADRSTR